MPHLRSLDGLKMLRRHVKNWFGVLLVLLQLKDTGIAIFRDGQSVFLSSKDFLQFYESLYRHNNSSHGFTYAELNDKETMVTIPKFSLKLIIPHDEPVSFVLDEVFIMNVYGMPNLDGRHVLDIGAGFGETSLYFARLKGKVLAFEPNARCFTYLLRNVSMNCLEDSISPFNLALRGGYGPGSLKGVIESYNLSNLFVKMDCEGCEYDLLLNTEDDVFNKIDEIVFEYHGGHKLLEQRLRRLGFRVKRRREIMMATKK